MELKQVTTETGHVYEDEQGRKFIGVTTPFRLIEAPPLELWALRIGEMAAKRIAITAAGYGHGLHKVWEMMGKGELSSEKEIKEKTKPRYHKEALKLLVWFNNNVRKVYFTEHRVVDTNLYVAGTLDTILELKNRPGLAILDLKTGRVKAIAKMQMEVYRHAASETLEIPLENITERVVLSCNRERVKAQEYYFGVDNEDYLAYNNLVSFWRWSTSSKGKISLREAKKL